MQVWRIEVMRWLQALEGSDMGWFCANWFLQSANHPLWLVFYLHQWQVRCIRNQCCDVKKCWPPPTQPHFVGGWEQIEESAALLCFSVLYLGLLYICVTPSWITSKMLMLASLLRKGRIGLLLFWICHLLWVGCNLSWIESKAVLATYMNSLIQKVHNWASGQSLKGIWTSMVLGAPGVIPRESSIGQFLLGRLFYLSTGAAFLTARRKCLHTPWREVRHQLQQCWKASLVQTALFT